MRGGCCVLQGLWAALLFWQAGRCSMPRCPPPHSHSQTGTSAPAPISFACVLPCPAHLSSCGALHVQGWKFYPDADVITNEDSYEEVSTVLTSAARPPVRRMCHSPLLLFQHRFPVLFRVCFFDLSFPSLPFLHRTRATWRPG